MARKPVIYVSSTFVDLKEHRAALKLALEKAQYDVESMEKYPAFDQRPLDKCLADVARADMYVLIVAHRYGYRPKSDNPAGRSITHLEYDEAGGHDGKPRLVFTVDPDHPWSPKWIDKGDDARDLEAFRATVEDRHGVNRYSDPDQLASLVLQALRALESTVVGPDERSAEQILTLVDELGRKNRQINEQEDVIGRLQRENEELRRAAVARTLIAAAQPDASKAAVAAANALEAGDSRPAEALLGKQERMEAKQVGRAGVDDALQRRQAAALAREQGALAMGHDAQAALVAFQRAADYEPNDTWTHFLLGDLLRSAGDLGGAMQSFERGAATVAARLEANADDPDAQRDLAVSHNRIGDALVAQGDGTKALEAYRKGFAIAKTLAARNAANTEWQRDLAVSLNRIGDVLVAQGDGERALATYREGLAIAEALAARDADNTEWQRDLAVSHNRIGDVLVAQGDGSGALESHRKGLAIAETLVARAPTNTQWQRDVAVSHNKIGNVLVAQGDGTGALAAFRSGLTITESLAASDAGNTEWQRDLAVSHNRIGDALVAQGDGAGALEAFRKGLAIAEVLAARDAVNAQWQRDLSVSHNKIGDVLLAQGDEAGALAAYRKGLAIAEDLVTRDAGNAQWETDLAYSCAKLGTTAYGQSVEVRRAHLLRGREVLAKLKTEGRLLPNLDWIGWFDGQIAQLSSNEA